MTSRHGCWSKSLVRVTAVAVVAAGASACSSVPDWVDPTTWIGDDQSAANTADQSNAENNGQTPDLSSIPDKPASPSTEDERKQAADTLAADRTGAQYSADSLRGGTEPSAAPPPPPSTADATAETQTPAPSSTAAEPTSSAGASEQTSGSAPATTDNSSASGAASAQTEQSANAAENQEESAAAPAASAPPVAKVASTEEAAPPAAENAMVSAPQISAGVASSSADDSQLGFQPSKAPALDASVSQFVAAPILAEYQQTAAAAAAPGLAGASATESASKPIKVKKISSYKTADADGAMVTHDATAATPAVYDNPQGLPPTAVVFFPHDTTVLDATAKAKVKEAAQTFVSRGEPGYVRVVGHSSSRTGNLPPERHLEYIFERSQARATAVAHELIRDGVPASKVLVEAVGDSQPVNDESMSQGEDGNRRAEIFM